MAPESSARNSQIKLEQPLLGERRINLRGWSHFFADKHLK
jgi:hypothetical protein